MQVPASYLTAAGDVNVNVFNPAPGGGTSAPKVFSVLPNPFPVLTGISPSKVSANGPSFVLTLTGSNFIPTSTVKWAGQADLIPLTQSDVQQTVQVPASYIVATGTPSITVVTPAPGGGTSPALTFSILPPNPVPVLTSLSPNSVASGSGSFALTLTGSKFIPTSVVKWLGKADLTPQSQTYTQLTVLVPAGYVASNGNVLVSVFNPPVGGGSSDALPFKIASPGPTLDNLSPVLGSTAGGTTVTFDATSATGVSVTGATSATCVTPAHVAGKVDVVVTANSQSATKAGAFTYIPHFGTNVAPVFASPPAATPNPAVAGAGISFAAQATDADGDALDYAWDFGDTTSGSGAAVSKTFAAPGIYTVTVTVSDAQATVSASVDVAVNAAPVTGLPFVVSKPPCW